MKKIRILLFFRHLLKTDPIVWVFLAFLISYLLFFVRPVFFSEAMNFPKYVPALKPIGADLKNTLNVSSEFLVNKQTPYYEGDDFAYPPLTILFVSPLLFFDNLTLAYKIVTVVNVICYVLITLVFPFRLGKKIIPLTMLIFITGLFSYGFQFELERGQFNLIAISICFLAIWIFHYRDRFRYLAYILFTISVQLKVFPFIFIFMFIKDWRNWKNTFKRFLLLLTMNILALFVLGPKLFIDFIEAIRNHTNNPYIWPGNHSIHSFITQVFEVASRHDWTWANQYARTAEIVLFAIVIGCIFIIMFQSYRQRQKTMNPVLLLALTIGALIIPSASHDYTLSFLSAPVSIYLSSNMFSARAENLRLRFLLILFLIIFSFSYFYTLFSYIYKSYNYIFVNNFPALFMMLLIVTLFSLVSKPTLK